MCTTAQIQEAGGAGLWSHAAEIAYVWVRCAPTTVVLLHICLSPVHAPMHSLPVGCCSQCITVSAGVIHPGASWLSTLLKPHHLQHNTQGAVLAPESVSQHTHTHTVGADRSCTVWCSAHRGSTIAECDKTQHKLLQSGANSISAFQGLKRGGVHAWLPWRAPSCSTAEQSQAAIHAIHICPPGGPLAAAHGC